MRRARRALTATLLALAPAGPAAAEGLIPAGIVEWIDPAPEFGGFSGLLVSPGGAHFVAVGDRGTVATGRLIREAGRLTRVETLSFAPLRDRTGAPLTGFAVDAEGIAPLGTGFAVSFEAEHRVARYTAPGAAAERLPAHPDFPGLQNNSALEALAAAPDGTLYAIPERSGRLDRPFPVYRYRDGAWDVPFSVPRRGDYLVTGAEIGPDGHLWVLERDFRWLGGFAVRLRRFVIGPGELSDERVMLEPGRGALDNMEGVSIWRGADGRLRVTLLSDDNFSVFQRTIFAEYVLAE